MPANRCGAPASIRVGGPTNYEKMNGGGCGEVLSPSYEKRLRFGARIYEAQRFAVYDREDEPCRRCHTPIRRILMGGRGTYFCPGCQQ